MRQGKIIIKGEIEALTGLMIGGTNTSMQIGGLDKSIVRNPVTKRPYIPGSSLKGKIRSLVDLRDGTIQEEEVKDKDGRVVRKRYKTTQDHRTVSGRLFGTARDGKDDNQRPSRIIFRDSELTEFNHNDIRIQPDDLKDTDSLYTEFKAENFIDRITSEATPRTFERVPRGGIFAMEIILNYHFEEERQDLAEMFKALQLLQDDYLGGSGSRGNGQVKIRIQSVTERTSAFYQGKADEKKMSPTEANVPKDLQ